MQRKHRPEEREEGERVPEGLGTLPLRQTLALILHTVWKMRAIFQLMLEPVLMVMMSNDECVVILLYYSKTTISVSLKDWVKARPDSLLQ